ncbi:hypothetical protein ACJ0RS_000897, partial [Serratia quinivorans]
GRAAVQRVWFHRGERGGQGAGTAEISRKSGRRRLRPEHDDKNPAMPGFFISGKALASTGKHAEGK